jgi:hypothetical protein
MSIYHPLDLELLRRISSSPDCTAQSVTATRGERFGVLVHHHARPVGLWSYLRGAFCFRGLASWDIIQTASDVEQVIALTVSMALKNKWQA